MRARQLPQEVRCWVGLLRRPAFDRSKTDDEGACCSKVAHRRTGFSQLRENSRTLAPAGGVSHCPTAGALQELVSSNTKLGRNWGESWQGIVAIRGLLWGVSNNPESSSYALHTKAPNSAEADLSALLIAISWSAGLVVAVASDPVTTVFQLPECSTRFEQDKHDWERPGICSINQPRYFVAYASCVA
jgi:hypothetical protein